MKTGIEFREGIVAPGALISFEFKMSKKKKKDTKKIQGLEELGSIGNP